MNREEIPARILKIRNETKLSQKALANKIGIAYRTWQDIENGKNIPSGETLLKIRSLGFNPGWILTGEGEMHTNTMAAPSSTRSIDTDVLIKIADAVTDVFKNLGQHPSKTYITGIAADIYNAMLNAQEPTDFTSAEMLKVDIDAQMVRLRNRIIKGEITPDKATT